MKVTMIYCVVFLFIFSNKIIEAIHQNITKNTLEIIDQIASTQKEFDFSQNIELLLEILNNLNNPKCIEDSMFVLNSARNNEKWALELFDSFPKFPLGLLYGNYYQLGNFDECINVYYNENENSIRGQYCLSTIMFHFKNGTNIVKNKNRLKFQNNLLHWGLCLPSSCTPHDGATIIEYIFRMILNNYADFNATISQDNCYYKGDSSSGASITINQIIYGCAVLTFLIFIMFATLTHLIHKQRIKQITNYNIDRIRSENTSIRNEIIFSFSILNNIKKFLNTKPNELNLECLYGIKTLSMLFILSGHTLIFTFGGPMANVEFFEKATLELPSGIFLNPLLVDTFLLVSGFLMCRLLLIELQKRNGNLNVLILYVARYIRLTPAYLVIIGFYLSWLPQIGNGPLWKEIVTKESNRCWKSWWTNLLYINNYVNTDSLCMFQSWYLAVDYHLFIIAPIIIYPLYKWKKTGICLLTVGTAGAVTIPFLITLKQHLDPTLLGFPPEIRDLSENTYFINSYIKTHMRAASYFLGLILGYIIHTFQANGYKIPQFLIWFGWVLTIVFSTISMFSIVIFFNPNYQHDDLTSAMYASFHRVAWAVAIGWIIFVCVTNNAEMINKFLSWNAWIPLSRLTYCAYLMNGIIELYHKGTIRESLFLNRFELSCRVLGHIVLTFAFAFVLCICFESPINSLEKILLRKNNVSKPVKTEVAVMRNFRDD